jgi:hypothetical protein
VTRPVRPLKASECQASSRSARAMRSTWIGWPPIRTRRSLGCARAEVAKGSRLTPPRSGPTWRRRGSRSRHSSPKPPTSGAPRTSTCAPSGCRPSAPSGVRARPRPAAPSTRTRTRSSRTPPRRRASWTRSTAGSASCSPPLSSTTAAVSPASTPTSGRSGSWTTSTPGARARSTRSSAPIRSGRARTWSTTCSKPSISTRPRAFVTWSFSPWRGRATRGPLTGPSSPRPQRRNSPSTSPASRRLSI